MTIQRSLKKALQNPEAVTGLDLRQAKPATLFPEISKFINLEYIDLSNCTTLDWADACIKLSKLPRLAAIKAFGADIKTLPAEFGLLTALKKIDLSSNGQLSALPETFNALTALEDINLYGCGLTTLPGAVWNFPTLHTLTMGRNKLQSIPPSFFDGMPNLQNLFIADNQLQSLPEGIMTLKKLTTLYAGNNSLTVLPENMGALTGLTLVWLDTCPALDFEKELTKLKNISLKELSIMGNNLTVLPSAIKTFTSLEVLNINSNNLHDTWQLLQDLAALPLQKLDIRFMGTEHIILEKAQTIIPTLQEIASDTRSQQEFSADIATWLNNQLVK